MANFFLIDHSLRECGGHHFDYVRSVARAATGMGFDTTVGAHTSLPRSSDVEEIGRVRRCFQHSTYQRDSYITGVRQVTRAKNDFLQESKLGGIKRSVAMFKKLRHRRRRQKFIRRFALDCDRFFSNQIFMEGDHAFFATTSELEFMGLAAFLAHQPRTIQVHWHLQFHFNLFEGRTPEYDRQFRVASAVQACFDTASVRIPYHSVNFYVTSDALADQYNRLGVGTFEVLPYPVAPEFLSESDSPVNNQVYRSVVGKIRTSKVANANEESATVVGFPSGVPQSFDGEVRINVAGDANSRVTRSERAHEGPLRFTCPGAIRREKGQAEYLQPLVNQIWDSHLATGEAQLVVQRPASKWPGKEKIELQLPESQPESPHRHSAIEYNPHPLARAGYQDLIRSTDCGLLLYDDRVYYSRRAGILGELLSCGRPVIVPAGTWLAEQIQDCGFEHVEEVVRNSDVTGKWDLSDVKWDSKNVPLPGGIISFDKDRHPFRFGFDVESASEIVLQMDWHWPQQRGVYCRVEVEQFDSAGLSLGKTARVVGHREGQLPVSAYYRLDSEASNLQVQLRTAFHDAAASVKNLQALGLGDREENRGKPATGPTSSVGIIACDRDDITNCIAEMVQNYDHYRLSAEAFAARWRNRHHPKRTVAHLIAVEHADARAA